MKTLESAKINQTGNVRIHETLTRVHVAIAVGAKSIGIDILRVSVAFGI
jgi:hypothetical protein